MAKLVYKDRKVCEAESGAVALQNYAIYLEKKNIGRIFVHAFEQKSFDEPERSEMRKKWSGLMAHLDPEKNLYVVKDMAERNSIISIAGTGNLTIFSFDGAVDPIAIISGRNSKTGVFYKTWVRQAFEKFVRSCDSFVLFGTPAVDLTRRSMEGILARLGMGAKEVGIEGKYALRPGK